MIGGHVGPRQAFMALEKNNIVLMCWYDRKMRVELSWAI